jgi:hypothetical protein
MQEVHVAYLAGGLVEGLVTAEIGVLYPRIPLLAALRVGLWDLGRTALGKIWRRPLWEFILDEDEITV